MKSFEILSTVRQFNISATGGGMARTNEDVDLFVLRKKFWAEKLEGARKTGKILFPGPLYRLSRLDGNNIYLGPTDYEELVGTNIQAGIDPEYKKLLEDRGRERCGDPDAFFSNALAVCSVIKTSDGLIVVGLRSNKVADYPNCWHTVGGHPDPRNYAPKNPNLLNAIMRELCRELGIDEIEISSISCLGIVRNIITKKPEMVFSSCLSLTFEELKKRRGPERDEHFRFFGVEPEDLAGFLAANQLGFAFPPGHGLTETEQQALRPTGAGPFLVPPGEAAWTLFLEQ